MSKENRKAPPQPVSELTMFEKLNNPVDSSGTESANASRNIEVIASYVFPN